MGVIETSLLKLLDYMEINRYAGYDPYDILTSPVFKLPLLRSNKTIRFYAQQAGKRFPLNMRPLLLVPKGTNPVTLGLSVQAYSYLSEIFPDQKTEYLKRAGLLITALQRLIPPGFSGACWGYDFDWESRAARIPAFQPTVVATGTVSNGLFNYYSLTGDSKARELILSSAQFVLNDLRRTPDGESFCFSYSASDDQRVLNASMKGARILAQAYSLSGESTYIKEAKKSVDYVIRRQNEVGSWPYSDKRRKIDNYHTGYVLDCLDEYIRHSGDEEYRGNLEKGFAYYKSNFFESDSFPKFYNDHKYPLDCTAGGQALLSLVRFGELQMAERVAFYLIDDMQDHSGYFYFREFPSYRISTSFMRWSNAWMLVGLSYLVNERKKAEG